MRTPALLLAVGMLAACTGPTPTANTVTPVAVNGVEEVMPSEGDGAPDAAAANATATADATAEAAYVGRWTGVEGMYLDVSARPGGGVVLEMQWDLDNKGDYEGTVKPDGLHFLRGGVEHVARRTNGDATGLKYLAGKKDCLTVKPGEGYCRG